MNVFELINYNLHKLTENLIKGIFVKFGVGLNIFYEST